MTHSVLADPIAHGDIEFVEASREKGAASDAGFASRMTTRLLGGMCDLGAGRGVDRSDRDGTPNPFASESPPAQRHGSRPGSAALHAGSSEIGGQYGLQCRHVLNDRASALQRARRPVVPARIGAEHEECVPDELTRRAVGVAEDIADPLLVVPVVGRAPVDEQVGHVEAGVERHHGEPDDVDAEVGVGVSLEDLRLHLTGAALTDASGRRQQQKQAWLSIVRVEGGFQRVDALQLRDLPRLGGDRARLLRTGASGEQERGEGRYDEPCPHPFRGYGRWSRCARTVLGVLEAMIVCPVCGESSRETMPTGACQWIYACEACGARSRPLEGDCCVFCSYSDQLCPTKQAGDPRC